MFLAQIISHRYFSRFAIGTSIILFVLAGWHSYTPTQPDTSWKQVQATDSITAYQTYLSNPTAKHKKAAQTRLALLQQDALQYQNASNAQTEEALQHYVSQCKKPKDCPMLKQAKTTLETATRITNDFAFHLRVKNLSQGSQGYALQDIENLKQLFPQDPKLKSWQQQVAKQFVQLAKKHLKNQNLLIARNHINKALALHHLDEADDVLAAITAATTEQAKVEQIKSEQAKAEQEKIEQEKIAQAKIEQEKAEQAKAEQARIEQEKTEQAKAASLDLDKKLALLKRCESAKNCTEAILVQKESLRRYQDLKKTFVANIENTQLTIPNPTSAKQNLAELGTLFPKAPQNQQWANTIADSFLRLAKKQNDNIKMLSYVQKGLAFSPKHAPLLALQKETSLQLSDDEKYQHAKQQGTMAAIQFYLAQCADSCNPDARDAGQKATTLSKSFHSHLANTNLTKGADGSALADLYALKALFPKDPVVLEFESAILEKFSSLIQPALAQKNYDAAKRYLSSAFLVNEKSPDLLALAKQLRKASPAHEVDTKDTKLVPKMIYVPAGSFTMGGKFAYAKPARKVKLKAFKISQTEVTFNQFLAYARAKGVRINSSRWGTSNRPAINVSWRQAVGYAKWLSRKTGRKFRLPSESEWEYAAHRSDALLSRNKINTYIVCRYGNGADRSVSFPWKNTKCKDGVGSKTAPVKSYRPNTLGLYDMHGNVWEWTMDCWHQNFKGAPASNAAWTRGGNCGRRVVKGGGWNSSPDAMLPAYRDSALANIEYNYIGFRIVETL